MSGRFDAGAALRVALPAVNELRVEGAPPRPADELRLSAPEPRRARGPMRAALPHVSEGALSTLRASLGADLPALFRGVDAEHAATLHARLEAVNKMASLLRKLASMDGEVRTRRGSGEA